MRPDGTYSRTQVAKRTAMSANGLAHRVLLLLSVAFGLQAHPSLFRDSELVRAAAVLILTDSAFAAWTWWKTRQLKPGALKLSNAVLGHCPSVPAA